jgi:hypothetical protein
MMIESGLQVDDEEGGAVEREGGVAGDEGLPGLPHQHLVAVARIVRDEHLSGNVICIVGTSIIYCVTKVLPTVVFSFAFKMGDFKIARDIFFFTKKIVYNILQLIFSIMHTSLIGGNAGARCGLSKSSDLGTNFFYY